MGETMLIHAMNVSLDLMNGILLFLNSTIPIPGLEAWGMPIWLGLALVGGIGLLALGMAKMSK